MRFLLIFVFLFSTNALSAETVERIIAIVNNEIITLSDVSEYKSKLRSDSLVDQAVLQFKDQPKLMKDEKYLISHLIDEKLVDSEIKRSKLSITFEKVDQEIRRIASTQGVSREQLKAALQERGIKYSDYQDFIKTSIERRSLIEKEVQSKVKISEEDVTSYYISKFGTTGKEAFEYQLAHILTLNENGGKKAALEKAEKAMAKLQSGEEFSAVAEQLSEDPNFTSGGLMGTFKSGEMRKEIERAIGKLDVGETTKVIPIPQGFQIVKVVKKTLTTNPEIASKTNSIRQVLMADAIKRGLKSWLDEQRERAFIRINK
tara:strand:+ start:110051 stop:111001 length:951 start_codon:yes stop_codon:yes gene_type:complete